MYRRVALSSIIVSILLFYNFAFALPFNNNFILQKTFNLPDRFSESILTFEMGTGKDYLLLESLVGNYDGEIKGTISFNGSVRSIVVTLPSEYLTEFAIVVSGVFDIAYIEPNHTFKACFIPNDSYWSLQWVFRKIEADFAWNTSIGNHSVLVAMVDTGVDWNHPDLADNYVSIGYDWVNLDADPMDDNGHGTHVAGIVAAVINNIIGVAGLSQVKIMAEKGWIRTVMGIPTI